MANKEIKICCYDNPATMQREAWQDGRLLYAYSAMLLCSKEKIPAERFFFGCNIGEWKTGQLFGTLDAMEAEGGK